MTVLFTASASHSYLFFFFSLFGFFYIIILNCIHLIFVDFTGDEIGRRVGDLGLLCSMMTMSVFSVLYCKCLAHSWN